MLGWSERIAENNFLSNSETRTPELPLRELLTTPKAGAFQFMEQKPDGSSSPECLSTLFPATETVPLLCVVFIAGPLISTLSPKVKCARLALDHTEGQRVVFSPSSAGGFVWRESSYRLSVPKNVRIDGSREDLNVMAKILTPLLVIPTGLCKTYIYV